MKCKDENTGLQGIKRSVVFWLRRAMQKLWEFTWFQGWWQRKFLQIFSPCQNPFLILQGSTNSNSLMEVNKLVESMDLKTTTTRMRKRMMTCPVKPSSRPNKLLQNDIYPSTEIINQIKKKSLKSSSIVCHVNPDPPSTIYEELSALREAIERLSNKEAYKALQNLPQNENTSHNHSEDPITEEEVDEQKSKFLSHYLAEELVKERKNKIEDRISRPIKFKTNFFDSEGNILKIPYSNSTRKVVGKSEVKSNPFSVLRNQNNQASNGRNPKLSKNRRGSSLSPSSKEIDQVPTTTSIIINEVHPSTLPPSIKPTSRLLTEENEEDPDCLDIPVLQMKLNVSEQVKMLSTANVQFNDGTKEKELEIPKNLPTIDDFSDCICVYDSSPQRSYQLKDRALRSSRNLPATPTPKKKPRFEYIRPPTSRQLDILGSKKELLEKQKEEFERRGEHSGSSFAKDVTNSCHRLRPRSRTRSQTIGVGHPGLRSGSKQTQLEKVEPKKVQIQNPKPIVQKPRENSKDPITEKVEERRIKFTNNCFEEVKEDKNKIKDRISLQNELKTFFFDSEGNIHEIPSKEVAKSMVKPNQTSILQNIQRIQTRSGRNPKLSRNRRGSFLSPSSKRTLRAVPSATSIIITEVHPSTFLSLTTDNPTTRLNEENEEDPDIPVLQMETIVSEQAKMSSAANVQFYNGTKENEMEIPEDPPTIDDYSDSISVYERSPQRYPQRSHQPESEETHREFRPIPKPYDEKVGTPPIYHSVLKEQRSSRKLPGPPPPKKKSRFEFFVRPPTSRQLDMWRLNEKRLEKEMFERRTEPLGRERLKKQKEEFERRTEPLGRERLKKQKEEFERRAEKPVSSKTKQVTNSSYGLRPRNRTRAQTITFGHPGLRSFSKQT